MCVCGFICLFINHVCLLSVWSRSDLIYWTVEKEPNNPPLSSWNNFITSFWCTRFRILAAFCLSHICVSRYTAIKITHQVQRAETSLMGTVCGTIWFPPRLKWRGLTAERLASLESSRPLAAGGNEPLPDGYSDASALNSSGLDLNWSRPQRSRFRGEEGNTALSLRV